MGISATRSGILVAILAASAVATPDAASAQGALPDEATAVSRASGSSPATAAAILFPSQRSAVLPGPVALRTSREVEAPPAPDLALQIRDRRGVPWMVAGGGLFLAGAVVGDDAGTILMLGGVGLGTYGAFVYFGAGRE